MTAMMTPAAMAGVALRITPATRMTTPMPEKTLPKPARARPF